MTACALRGVNRPLNIDGTDLPGPQEAPIAPTTVTCNNGVLSAAGGANLDPIDIGIACSSEPF